MPDDFPSRLLEIALVLTFILGALYTSSVYPLRLVGSHADVARR